ncbi:MAG: MFS transporter [Omnitrophica bacterium GWA2_52_12]|nr:MAG: MFS transporter [Omnitrophica bacterium GWA2_52_12]
MQTMKRILLRALRHRNYRLFFIGQGISLIGTWMTRVAMSWLVYRLTHSAVLLGVVSFAGQIPAFFIAPLAGVYIDRLNLHKILIATQILAMLQSLLLAVLALTGTITIPQILLLSILQGLINGVDMPARQSFMIHMVEDSADLSNAIALNSSIVNGARLLGPSIAGLLIAVSGEGVCFLVDGVSYLAVIYCLYAMTVRKVDFKPVGNVLQSLREGVEYAFGADSPIRSILLLLAIVSFMGLPYMMLMPIFADRLAGGGPQILGFLMGAAGLGALAAGLSLAARKHVRGLVRWMPLSTAILGVSLIVFAFSHSLWLSLPLTVVAGYGMMMEMAVSNTILQTIVDDNKRGRVMSFYTMSFVGMAPLGSLWAGFLAQKIGADHTLMIGGTACLTGALFFSLEIPRLRELIRPIYIRKGIIQKTLSGVQAAAALSED